MRVVCDEGNRQLSEVEFEGSGDDVDVLVGIRGDVGLLSICGANQAINEPNDESVAFSEGSIQSNEKEKGNSFRKNRALTSIKGQLDIFNQLTEA